MRSSTRAPDRLRATRPAPRRAFTLIELLSAVLIVGLLAAISLPSLSGAITKARISRAIGDIRTLMQDVTGQEAPPATLAAIGRANLRDPWGRPYVYVKFPSTDSTPPSSARSDRFGVPVNLKFDLYSRGPNGQSAVGLTAGASRDDIIVGADGAFIGLASKY